MKITHLLLITLFLPMLATAQFSVANYRSELNIKLSVIEEKRLEKGVELLNEAVVTEYEALGILETLSDTVIMMAESREYMKMFKTFMEASQQYQEGHMLIYTVFHENCDNFKEEMKKISHYASGMNKAKYYYTQGEKTMTRARNIRQMLIEAEKPEWIQYKMHEALELEKIAIRDKGRALQIMQDFPVEYNYGWDNDVSEEVLAEYFKNPLVKLPPEEVFRRVPKEEKKEPEGGFVEFRIQIAAHTVQIDKDYIKTFYTGNDTVNEVREGAWFKYQIGNYETFADADSGRVACRVPRAFIVAYQGGNKITIKKALAVLQENQ